jgi:hypothetical protein
VRPKAKRSLGIRLGKKKTVTTTTKKTTSNFASDYLACKFEGKFKIFEEIFIMFLLFKVNFVLFVSIISKIFLATKIY